MPIPLLQHPTLLLHIDGLVGRRMHELALRYALCSIIGARPGGFDRLYPDASYNLRTFPDIHHRRIFSASDLECVDY